MAPENTRDEAAEGHERPSPTRIVPSLRIAPPVILTEAKCLRA